MFAQTHLEAQKTQGAARPGAEDEWLEQVGLVPESTRRDLRALAFEDIVVPCLTALRTQLAA